jgi:hypothetical protein
MPLTDICYLCGNALTSPTSNDHVPPRQLYVKEIRVAHSPNLLTLPTHTDCNRSYQHDEDYFVNTLAPLARGSYSGNALLKDVFDKYGRGQKRPLVHKVVEEFDRTPSGLQLPPNLVTKRIDGPRVHRVAWKIIRGLYFHEFGEYLPESTPNLFSITPPDNPPAPTFSEALGDLPSRGAYPGVFDYKFTRFRELNDFNYWGLLLWDRLILTMTFHSPHCQCEHCVDLRSAGSGNESRSSPVSLASTERRRR